MVKIGGSLITDDRKRIFATIVYPESAPADWINILRDLHSPVIISPLHDKDQYEDEETRRIKGEYKKAHYHVMFLFEGKQKQEEIDEIYKQIGAVGNEKIRSTRGYARYLCHLDEDGIIKPYYDIDRVICLGGANYSQYLDNSTSKYVAIREMINYCRENNVVKVRELMEYASHNQETWFNVLCDGGLYVMREYLR